MGLSQVSFKALSSPQGLFSRACSPGPVLQGLFSRAPERQSETRRGTSAAFPPPVPVPVPVPVSRASKGKKKDCAPCRNSSSLLFFFQK
ncbi:hypothetical protein HYQ44_015247 [Verticillium longisporum]|nr:hypothetical protein HYQ44_015247 [Verticillium longisporum]